MANQTAMAQAIVQSMLSSVDVVINGRLKELAFDKTIEGTIIEPAKEHPCAYRVQYQDSVLVAYAKETDTFYKGDTVLLHIPQGNFDNQKTILGKKTNDDSPTGVYNFKLPFDDFIGLNRLTPQGGAWSEAQGFRANDPDDGFQLITTGQPILTYPDPNASAEIQEQQRRQLEKAIGSSKLGLEVNIQTLLGAEMPISGDYGLKVLITGMTKSSEYGMSEEQTLYGDFVTSDVYGNPYNFLIPYTQEKLFDVSNFLNISKIQIYFLQNWNFKANNGELISYQDSITGEKLPPNILFSNLNLYLGLTADELTDDKVFLYSYDDALYSTVADTKELRATWVHRMDNGFMAIDTLDETPFHIEDDGEQAKMKYDVNIYWYRKVIGTEKTNKYGGVDWEIINATDEVPDYIGEDENGNPIIETHTEERLQDYTLTIVPNVEQNFDRFKVVVVYGNKAYPCEEHITFQNSIDVETLNESLSGNSEIVLKIFSLAKNTDGQEELVEDPWEGNFYIYDENCRSIYDETGTAFSDKIYYIQLYKRAPNGDYYPLIMDSSAGPIIVNWGDEEEWTRRYSMIKSFRPVMSIELPYDKLNAQFMRAFTIAGYYNVQNNDNTIMVTVDMDGRRYYVNRELAFGRTGTQGSEYSVTIELENGAQGILFNQRTTAICKIRDRYGNIFTPTAEDDITYTWEILTEADDETGGSWTPSEQIVGPTYSFQAICAPLIRVTVRGAFSKYPLMAIRGFLGCNNAAFLNRCDFTLPNRIEFQSDGTAPIYDTSAFEIYDTETTEHYYPTWELHPSDSRYKKSVALVPTVIGGYTALKQNIVNGVMEGYTRTINEPITKYSLDAAKLVWNETLDDDYTYMALYAHFQVDDTYIIVNQAIAIAQNTYSSSLVNTWNGQTLDIDEDNGTIVGRSIAAGTKDSRNRFTGVMLGDWAEYGDESLEMAGLYGFQQGIQTFGFKRDGTAFIGKAGGGQINFDGNRALISNADETCYINLNPIPLQSLTDFNLNTVSGSPYFLYSCVDHIDTDETRINKSWASHFLNDNAHDYFVVDANYGVITSGTILSNSGLIGNWELSKFGLMQGYSYPLNNNLNQSGRYVYLGYSPMNDNEYKLMEAQLTAKYSELATNLDTEYDTALTPKTLEYNSAKDAAETAYANGSAVAEEQFQADTSDMQAELEEIDNAEAEELRLLYQEYQDALNALKSKYTTDQNALRRKYDEDLQAAAMADLPALCQLDPQHFLNYSEPLQIIYDCVMDNFLNPDALYKNITDTNTIRVILQEQIAAITQDFKHWYARYHDHYNFNGNQVTRQTKINVGQLNIISSVVGIPVGTGHILYEPQVVDRYGTKVLYSEATGTYEPVSTTKWMAINTSSVVTTTIQSFYALRGTTAQTQSYQVVNLNSIASAGNNGTAPWSRERLTLFIESAAVALQGVSEGYDKQIQLMLNAAGTSIDEDVKQALYQKLLEDLAALEAAYRAACLAVPPVSDDLINAVTDKYDKLRAAVEAKYADLIQEATLALDREMKRLSGLRDAALRAAKNAYDTFVSSLDREYINKKQDLDARLGEAIANIYKYDNNKYAIYIGQHSVYDTITSGFHDEVPLFSVRWDGAMQARKGLIGNNSPWVISDDGIAQTVISNQSLTNAKFFGTIYLGNPVVDTDFATNWEEEQTFRTYNDYVGALDDNNESVIPQQSGGQIWAEQKHTVNGYKVRDRIEYLGLAHSVNGNWTREGTNERLIRYLDNSEQFCFYAGTDHINLGLRMDGYLFSQYGKIAGWYIEPNRLIKYINDSDVSQGEAIELNSNGYIYLNNHNIILDGLTGAVTIGNNQTQGLISLAGFFINGGAGIAADAILTGVTSIDNADTVINPITLTLPGGDAQLAGMTIRYHYLYGTLMTANTTLSDGSLLQFLNNDRGVELLASKTSDKWIVWRPTNNAIGYLLDWNIKAKDIYAQSIYATESIVAPAIYLKKGTTITIDDQETEIYELVATEYWVTQIANKIHTELGNLGSKINSALQKIGTLAANAFQDVDITPELYGPENGMTQFKLKFYRGNIAGLAESQKADLEVGGSDVLYSTNANHKHNLVLTGSQLRMSTAIVSTPSTDTIDLAMDVSYQDGKFTFTQFQESKDITIKASNIYDGTNTITAEISKLKATLNDLIEKYNTHTHGTTPTTVKVGSASNWSAGTTSSYTSGETTVGDYGTHSHSYTHRTAPSLTITSTNVATDVTVNQTTATATAVDF